MRILQNIFMGLALFIFLGTPTYAMLPVVDIAAIAQLANQLGQLKQQAQYLKLTLKQLGHGQFSWGDTQALMGRLEQLTDQTTGAANDAMRLDKQFRDLYPGYQASLHFSEAYKNNVNTALKKLNGVSQALHASADNFNTENLRLRFLQQQAEQAQGQTQAIQAASQLTSETVSQIQLLRQSVLAQSQAQVAFYATQIQKEASTQAELEKVLKAGSTTLPLYGSGHALSVPNF